MGDLSVRNQLLYIMENHITGKKNPVCIGYSHNIVATLDGQETRDLCTYYLAAFVTKRLGIPFVANDYEYMHNRANRTIDMYQRLVPFKQSMALDHKKLRHIATLHLQLLPTDREYQEHAIDVYEEHKLKV